MDNGNLEMGNRILYLREQLGLTQAEFGKRICLTPKQVSRLECGQNRLTDRNIKIICYEFDVNMDWLCYNKGEIFRDARANMILQVYDGLTSEMKRCAEILLTALAENQDTITKKD